MSIFENVRIYKSVSEHGTGDTGKNRLFVSPVKIFTSDSFEAFLEQFFLQLVAILNSGDLF